VITQVFEIVSVVVLLISNVWFLICAYRIHLGWCIGTILVPLCGIYLAFLYWDKFKEPVLLMMTGYATLMICLGASGSTSDNFTSTLLILIGVSTLGMVTYVVYHLLIEKTIKSIC
jgi:hypothetical protein